MNKNQPKEKKSSNKSLKPIVSFLETNPDLFTKDNLFFISKNFGLHDPDVINFFKNVLPSISKDLFKKYLNFNKLEATAISFEIKGFKLFAKITYLEDQASFYLFFSRKDNFEIEDVVGSGSYHFKHQQINK